jgi:hypothetical protein
MSLSCSFTMLRKCMNLLEHFIIEMIPTARSLIQDPLMNFMVKLGLTLKRTIFRGRSIYQQKNFTAKTVLWKMKDNWLIFLTNRELILWPLQYHLEMVLTWLISAWPWWALRTRNLKYSPNFGRTTQHRKNPIIAQLEANTNQPLMLSRKFLQIRMQTCRLDITPQNNLKKRWLQSRTKRYKCTTN